MAKVTINQYFGTGGQFSQTIEDTHSTKYGPAKVIGAILLIGFLISKAWPIQGTDIATAYVPPAQMAAAGSIASTGGSAWLTVCYTILGGIGAVIAVIAIGLLIVRLAEKSQDRREARPEEMQAEEVKSLPAATMLKLGSPKLFESYVNQRKREHA